MKENTIAVSGLKSVRVLFSKKPASIVRLFFNSETSRQVGIITKALADARKVYRLVEDAELQTIAGTIHHGGIVAIVTAPPIVQLTRSHVSSWAQRKETLLLLDGVGNPHNLGAIVRTAAWFGVRNIILPQGPGVAMPSEAAWRVSEGGMAFVHFYRCQDLADFCNDIKELYDVLGTALGESPIEAATEGKPVALVLGNEERGLSDRVARACTRLVTIPGSGQVESLNVSAAAAILLWEFAAPPRKQASR